jgi:AcrR family transcriptional regulator
MRVIKEPEERRNEILDTAETLFFTKGYGKTTVNDILQAIGIAKGTFYYYFKSKEEVMDAVLSCGLLKPESRQPGRLRTIRA